MALNKTDLSFKKLINKEFTDPARLFFQEATISTLDLNSTEVYTGVIGATTASVIDAGIGRKLTQFLLTPDPTYPTTAWHLQSGSGFTPGTTYTAGLTQRNFLSDKYGTEYEVKLYDYLDNQIFKTDAINWIFDYKSGILHVADPGAYTTPYKVTAVQYTGPTLSGSLAGLSGSVANISTSQISSGSTSIQLTTGSITTVVGGVTSSFTNETSVTFYTPVTGSFSGSFAGSLDGTASYANQALSSSYARTASYALAGNGLFSGSFSGSFQGDGSALTGIAATLLISGSTGGGTVDLKTQVLTVQGTPNEIVTVASGQTITVGLPTNVVIAGDLTVNGTTTTINTANLLIEDRFALFASGSTTGTDGGIVVQSNVAGTGFALGYNNASGRWALEDGLSGTATGFVSPNAFVGTVQTGSIAPGIITPAYGGSASGHGTIFINKVAGDIWIYA